MKKTSNIIKNKGFTLIELAIAIAVIGIIVAMLFNKFGKSFITTAKAEAAYSNVKQVAEAWTLLNNLCGTSFDPNASALSKAGAAWEYHVKLLSNPEDATYGIDTTKYRRCYAQSGFTGLSSIVKQESGCGWNGWNCHKLGDYYFHIWGYGGNRFGVNVLLSKDVAEQVWLNYNSAGSTTTTGALLQAPNMDYWPTAPESGVAEFSKINMYFN